MFNSQMPEDSVLGAVAYTVESVATVLAYGVIKAATVVTTLVPQLVVGLIVISAEGVINGYDAIKNRCCK